MAPVRQIGVRKHLSSNEHENFVTHRSLFVVLTAVARFAATGVTKAYDIACLSDPARITTVPDNLHGIEFFEVAREEDGIAGLDVEHVELQGEMKSYAEAETRMKQGRIPN